MAEIRHPTTGAVGAKTPEGDIVYGPLAERYLPPETTPAQDIRLDEITPGFIPDFTLNDIVPMDFAGIKAGAEAATAEVMRITEALSKMQPPTTPKEPAKEPTLVDKALGREPEKPEDVFERSMIEHEEREKAFFARRGLTEEDFQKTQEVQLEMASLNNQLTQLEVREMAEVEQATAGFGLSSIKGAVQSAIERRYAIQKAGLAAQVAAKSMEYNILQGRIDKAQADFEKALEFATYKEKQAVEDYRWALSFYRDIEESDRNYLLQEEKFAFTKYQQVYREEQDRLGFQLDWAREKRLAQEVVGIGLDDYFTSTQLKEIRRAGINPTTPDGFLKALDFVDRPVLSDASIHQMAARGVPQAVAENIATDLAVGHDWKSIFKGMSKSFGSQTARKYIDGYRDTLRMSGVMEISTDYRIKEPLPYDDWENITPSVPKATEPGFIERIGDFNRKLGDILTGWWK